MVKEDSEITKIHFILSYIHFTSNTSIFISYSDF